MVSLKQLSTTCDFGAHLDDALRDRFVCGLKSEEVQRRLLSMAGLTFKTACDIALAMHKNFRGHIKDTGTVNKVHMEQNKGGWISQSNSAQQSSQHTEGSSIEQSPRVHFKWVAGQR